MEDEVTIKQAQELLGVTKMTVYNLIKRGELHPRKRKVGSGRGGQRVWLRRAEVLALKEAEVAAGNAQGRKK